MINRKSSIPRNHKDDKAISSICVVGKKFFDLADTQVIGNVAYALVVLSYHTKPSGQVLLKKVFDAAGSDDLTWTMEGMSQLYMAQLALDIEMPDLNLKFPHALFARAKAAHIERALGASSSQFHRNVSDCLKRIGVQ